MNQNQVKSEMNKIIEIFKEDISTIRTGRATPALLEGITVSVYGGQQQMELQEVGTIMVDGARSLILQVWDKSIVKEVKNGIAQSSLGVNPIVDEDKIRINLPTLTTEQREDYVKLLHKKLEGYRVMIRDVRSQSRRRLQEAEQNKEISEDQFRSQEEDLQKLTDDYNQRLEEIAAKKEAEIQQV